MSQPPIHFAPLFRPLEQHLLELLSSLSDDDWRRPTVCSQWSVQDIASHLLDGAIRRLSAQRDRYVAPDGPQELNSPGDLLRYLNDLNASWTRVTRRISPRVLVDLLEVVSRQYVELWETADPQAEALFPVSWAGEANSLLWFDMARDYTERWHHQRQIALAVHRETPIDERQFYYPVLDTFMRALPHTFQGVNAEIGTLVSAEIRGPAGGQWFVERADSGWRLRDVGASKAEVTAKAVLPQDVAWRVFTKRLTSEAALERFPGIRLEGEQRLAARVLEMVSIVA